MASSSDLALQVGNRASRPDLVAAVRHTAGGGDTDVDIGVFGHEPLHRIGLEDTRVGADGATITPVLWSDLRLGVDLAYQRRDVGFPHRIDHDAIVQAVAGPHRLFLRSDKEDVAAVLAEERSVEGRILLMCLHDPELLPGLEDVARHDRIPVPIYEIGVIGEGKGAVILIPDPEVIRY